MLIPLIEKNPEANGFTCKDGEIEFEFITIANQDEAEPPDSAIQLSPLMGKVSLQAEGTYPTGNLRIPLLAGEAENVPLLLGGEISRVDPAVAERITQAIALKAAEFMLDITTDLRRSGLFILPFRVFTMTMLPDGVLSYPSPQAAALPADFPPHPEITASHVAADCLTLSLRIPVRPHRLMATVPDGFPSGHSLRTFISYPLYIPDPKEISASIGSVRSASGGNATGIRFAFLSSSRIKASVAAPEKYYGMVGNERTGYRISSKSIPEPDYSIYAQKYGYVAPFPAGTLTAIGADCAAEAHPLDWIADWEPSGAGYLPRSLPYIYRSRGLSPSEGGGGFPDGIDKDTLASLAMQKGMKTMLLTRPMALAESATSRRKAAATPIRSMRIHGIPDSQSLAILYGSADGKHWEALRAFDPRREHLLMSPPRMWHRLLILMQEHTPQLCLEIER